MTEDRIATLRQLAAKKGRPLHWYGLGMELRAAGQLDEAVLVFGRVHALDEAYVPAWFMRAQTHEELGQLDEARAALERGIAHAEAAGEDHAAGEMRSMLETLPE